MYDGPQAPDADTACIGIDTRGFVKREAAYITRVGRRSTVHFPNVYPGVARVCVRPGRHEISIYYELGQRCSTAVLAVDAKAGRTYRIRKIGDEDRVFFWVQEDPAPAPARPPPAP